MQIRNPPNMLYGYTTIAQEAPMLTEQLCRFLALSFLKPPLKRFGFRTESINRFDSMKTYIEDRVAQVSAYQRLFETFASFEGRTILDLGCNRGYLLHSFLQYESFDAIGADIDPTMLAMARKDYGHEMQLIQTTATTIPLPDHSIDITYTVDTVEHLSRVKDIFLEVHRVLKPGGIFLVHFNPWLNPYGSHLEDIIPFPWPHTIFSMKTLLKVAASLYDSPHYPTACYFIDEQTGLKKPNPYLDLTHWESYLNHMTIRRFHSLCQELPFEQVHQERIGFGGKTFKIGRLLRGLSQLRILDEFFTNALFTVLSKSTWLPSAGSRDNRAATNMRMTNIGSGTTTVGRSVSESGVRGYTGVRQDPVSGTPHSSGFLVTKYWPVEKPIPS